LLEGSNKPFKALIDTGADINLVQNITPNHSHQKTTRKASAVQADGSEIPNTSLPEQKHIEKVEDIHRAQTSFALTFYLTNKYNCD
jgi:hypothetical protein